MQEKRKCHSSPSRCPADVLGLQGLVCGWYIRGIAKSIRVLGEEGLTPDCIRHAMARFLLGGGGTREQQRCGQQRESYRVERQFVCVPHCDELRGVGRKAARRAGAVWEKRGNRDKIVRAS